MLQLAVALGFGLGFSGGLVLRPTVESVSSQHMKRPQELCGIGVAFFMG